MTANRNLVPVSTFDHSGEPITVYKVPSKAVMSATAKTDQARLAGLIQTALSLPPGSHVLLSKELESYGPEFLRELIAMVTQDDTAVGGALAALALQGSSKYVIREAALFFPDLTGMEDFEHGEALVLSLRYHSLPHEEDYSSASMEVQRQCLNLMQAIAALEATGVTVPDISYTQGIPVLKDDEFFRAITGDHDEAQRILEVIRNYSLVRYTEIRAVLDGTPAAVAAGVL